MFDYKIEHIDRAGVKLALHSWVPKTIKAILFYIHGKQSHAGWLFETAPFISKQAIALFVLDRRGSGLSYGERRGDVESLETMLLDYKIALQTIKIKYPTLPLTLFGQSFGGSILAGLLCWEKFDIDYNAVVFCASGLGLQNIHLLNGQPEVETEWVDLKIKDEAYTNDPRYLEFIKNDSLCIRSITNNTRQAFFKLESLYCNTFRKVGAPTCFIKPEHDPLVNYDIPLSIFRDITNNKGFVIQFPLRHHYIEFSDQRFLLWGWLLNYTVTAGYQLYA